MDNSELYAVIFVQAIGAVLTLVVAVWQIWAKRDTTRAEANKTTAEAYLGMVKAVSESTQLVVQISADRETMNGRVNKLEDDLQAIRGEKEKLAGRIVELEAISARHKIEIEALRVERDQLRQDLAEVKTDRAKFEKAKELEVGELLSKITLLEGRVMALEQENQRLKAELVIYEAKVNEAEGPAPKLSTEPVPMVVIAQTIGGGEASDSHIVVQEKAMNAIGE